MLDTARRISTPEGIELTLRLAGPVPRALAWAIDLVLRAILLGVIALATVKLRQFGTAIMLLSSFTLEWLYPAFFEATWGSTPGKRLMGLVVLNDDGTPVGWPAALMRNLLRTVDFLPALYLGGFLCMVTNRDFKRLGDLAANTLVVYRENKVAALNIPAAVPLAPGIALSIAEQRAILDFASRSPGLTAERAEELAGIAESLAGKSSADKASDRLIGMANYIVGRQ